MFYFFALSLLFDLLSLPCLESVFSLSESFSAAVALCNKHITNKLWLACMWKQTNKDGKMERMKSDRSKIIKIQSKKGDAEKRKICSKTQISSIHILVKF